MSDDNATSVHLNNAEIKEEDPLKEIKDPKQYLVSPSPWFLKALQSIGSYKFYQYLFSAAFRVLCLQWSWALLVTFHF